MSVSRGAWLVPCALAWCALVPGDARGQGAGPAAASVEAGPVVSRVEVAEEQRFVQATDAMARGEHRVAAEQFVAVADRAPSGPYAADALFTAARLYEERLLDPARALDLYRRLVREHPESRTALAAERRAETLAELLGTEQPAGGAVAGVDAAAQALARFTDILQGFPERGEHASLELAAALLAEHPSWSGVPRVLLWIAGVHQRAGRLDEAFAYYQRAADAAAATADADEHRFAAYRGAGDVEAARGRFEAAARYYRMMPTAGDPGLTRARDDLLAALTRDRLRARIHDIAWAVLLAVALLLVVSLRHGAGSWRDAWRIVRVPPIEVIFMLPIAAVLVAASLTAHYAIFPAVIIICVGGVAVTWLSGAGLAAAAVMGRRTRLRALVHAGAAALAVIALCYAAIHHNRLIDMIIETVRFGPDV